MKSNYSQLQHCQLKKSNFHVYRLKYSCDQFGSGIYYFGVNNQGKMSDVEEGRSQCVAHAHRAKPDSFLITHSCEIHNSVVTRLSTSFPKDGKG